MLFSTFTSLLGTAACVVALPTNPTTSDHDSSLYGQMVPQSFTTSDGETQEIWVRESYVPEFSSAGNLQRRVDVRNSLFHKTSQPNNRCLNSSFRDLTGPNAPTTGRCIAVMEWAAQNRGYFQTTRGQFGNGYLDLVSSSKSGATTCHFRIKHNAVQAYIGNTDIYDLINDSLRYFRRNTGGAERLRAEGTAGCEGDFVQDGRMAMGWRID